MSSGRFISNHIARIVKYMVEEIKDFPDQLSGEPRWYRDEVNLVPI